MPGKRAQLDQLTQQMSRQGFWDNPEAAQRVTSQLSALKAVVEAHVKAGKIFTLPGVLKVKVTRKPATKARKGVNPFTGQEMMFKAKPARNVVKIQALKSLKDLA